MVLRLHVGAGAGEALPTDGNAPKWPLKTVDLNVILLANLLGHEKFRHCHALITLDLNDFAKLLVGRNTA